VNGQTDIIEKSNFYYVINTPYILNYSWCD